MKIIAGVRRVRDSSAIALLVLALTGTAAHASTIHACVKPTSGATRIVSAKAKCRRGEKKMAWSTTGPAGPRGAAGTQGTAGAQGAEGKAGANGVGALFSASEGGLEENETETIAVTKIVPPGSYMVWGKAALLAESTKAGLEASNCFLVDRAGTTNTGEPTIIDVSLWFTELTEKEPGEFSAAGGLPLQGTLKTSVTTTLSVLCVADDDTVPGTKVHILLAQLQALAVTSIG